MDQTKMLQELFTAAVIGLRSDLGKVDAVGKIEDKGENLYMKCSNGREYVYRQGHDNTWTIERIK